ncbi:MAG: glycosyl transferase family 2 [Bacteroidetes bacterium HGW-Bacteroidetes-4]|nr:MAG: glycosyl transferase family 2 [Bacteroidetes bacterium HGW-Bacteroidetes-4]
MALVNLNVVVSVYNEEAALPLFYKELYNELVQLNISYQIIFVNDGSHDNSYEILKTFARENSRVKVINFSRNFGHEAAMLAGLDYSNAEALVFMDSDLQHPPNCLKQMYETYQSGADIITMIRKSRKDGGVQKNLMSKLFYGLLNKISKIKIEPNASDFFLISNRVAQVLKTNYRERTRFLRGLIQIIGFNKSRLEFVAPERIAGESKYSFMQLVVFSFSAISVLSKAPLRIGIYTGLVFAVLSIVVGLYSIIMRFLGQPFSGYTTIVVLMSTMFSILFFVLGIIGDYIGLLFDEAKGRPHYIVMDETSE